MKIYNLKNNRLTLLLAAALTTVFSFSFAAGPSATHLENNIESKYYFLQYEIKKIELTLIDEVMYPTRTAHNSVDNAGSSPMDFMIHQSEAKHGIITNLLQDDTHYDLVENDNIDFFVDGTHLRSDNSEPHHLVFKETAIKNVTRSMLTGRGGKSEYTYELAEDCSEVCPPKSTCESRVEFQPIDYHYNYQVTMTILDEGVEVPNSDFTVSSVMIVHDVITSECVTEEVRPLEAKPAAQANILSAGQTLQAGEKLMSPNGVYYLIMQQDGNFCLYKTQGDVFVWCMTGDGNRLKAGTVCTMQEDGNLNLSANGQWVWSVFNQVNELTQGSYLRLTNEGKAQIVAPNGEVKWQN